MKKLLLILSLVFAGACAAELADEPLDDGEAVELGVKQQALGTACPAELFAFQTSLSNQFGNSGWTGTWYLTEFETVNGTRWCGYNAAANGTHWLGYTTTFTSCSPVAGTNKKKWLCSGSGFPTNVTCPDSSWPAIPHQFRQTPGGAIQPWSAAGPMNLFHTPVSQYTPNSATWDSATKRIWCGYNQYTAYGTFAFSRPESF